MISSPRTLVRPALVLAGSVLALVAGLMLILRPQSPAAVPTAPASTASAPSTAGSSPPVPSTAAGPHPSSRPTKSPGSDVPRSSASIPAPKSKDSEPEKLEIAALGSALPIRPVGVAGDGSIELPEDPKEIGWYRFGPAPGTAAGSAVLAGHVDSREFGIGPLADLDRSRTGDTVTVVSSTGPTEYKISQIRHERRSQLPVEDLFDRTGPPRLVIITCGGPYTPGEGYRDNLIVTATPTRPAK